MTGLRRSRPQRRAARATLARLARGDLQLYLQCLVPGTFATDDEAETAALRYLLQLRAHVDALVELNADVTGSPAVTP